MFTEHFHLIASGEIEKVIYSSHDLLAAVTFCALQDPNKRAALGRVGVEVVSVLNTFSLGGGLAARARIGGAIAVGVKLGVHLECTGYLKLPSDWLTSDTADESLAFM
jgi:hypothetical protein